jgi:hypothetical protein
MNFHCLISLITNNIEEKDEAYHIETNEEMRNEIIVEAYVNGLNVCFDIQSVDDILSKDVEQEVERFHCLISLITIIL